MEHIGSGWQFDVYATGERVRKVPVTPLRMAIRVLRSYPGLLLRPHKLVAKVRKLTAERTAVLKELDRRQLHDYLLANFRNERGVYTQDRVTTLEDVFALSRLDARWVLDRYVQSIKSGWQSGMAETSFNFTVNHGMDRHGRVVVLDVGELSFDRDEALDLVASRFWERAYSVQTLPESLRTYLLRTMAREITPRALMRIWRDAPRRPIAPHAPDRPAYRRERTGEPATVVHA
ncbi:MAG: hypothetical protein JJ896_13975 [Rhodothermales bacterium]|nr:hypothetical protein [Rhodothermales bacterium]MBO6780758.1 hypothetical protein [Rhodothermales bacterium]